MPIARKQVFDLDAFDTVSVGKEFEFSPAATVEEALAAFGNDSKRLLAILNSGTLEAKKAEVLADPSIPLRTFKLDADNEETDELNGAYEGRSIPEDKQKDVNGMILMHAKMLFGFGRSMTREQKREAKEKARAAVKGNTALMAALAEANK